MGVAIPFHETLQPQNLHAQIKIYPGRVSFIASEAEFTPKQIQTPEERIKLVYRIKVELDNPNQELKLNMPVDAVIDLPPPVSRP